jgi:hypothetical protein
MGMVLLLLLLLQLRCRKRVWNEGDGCLKFIVLRAKAAKGFASSCSYDDMELEKTQQANWVQLRSGAGSISVDQGISMDGDTEMAVGAGTLRVARTRGQGSLTVDGSSSRGSSSLKTKKGEKGKGPDRSSRIADAAESGMSEMVQKARG